MIGKLNFILLNLNDMNRLRQNKRELNNLSLKKKKFVG